MSSEVPGHDADAQPDAKHVININGVSPRQLRQHKGERDGALLAFRVVRILDEIIVQKITAGAVALRDHLQPTEVGIAPELFDNTLVLALQAQMIFEAKTRSHCQQEKQRGRCLSAIDRKVPCADQHQDQRGHIHGNRVRKQGNQEIADEHRTRQASQSANRD
jgi:hypothetical protein